MSSRESAPAGLRAALPAANCGAIAAASLALGSAVVRASDRCGSGASSGCPPAPQSSQQDEGAGPTGPSRLQAQPPFTAPLPQLSERARRPQARVCDHSVCSHGTGRPGATLCAGPATLRGPARPLASAPGQAGPATPRPAARRHSRVAHWGLAVPATRPGSVPRRQRRPWRWAAGGGVRSRSPGHPQAAPAAT